MWRGGATVVASALALAAAAPGSQAATDRQTAHAVAGTMVPGAPAGTGLSIDWRYPSDPNAKPYAVDTIVIHLPPGSRFDFSALPKCTASDGELMLRGAAACPPASKVSTGTVLSDTGSPGGIPRFVHTHTVNFNADGELVGIGDADELPIRSILRSKIRGETVTIPVPDTPGGPPPDNFTAFKSLRTVGPPIVRGRRSYARTPPTCPASGEWTTRYTFVYHDGVTQSQSVGSPCRRNSNPCLARRSPVGPRGIGRIRLGRTRSALRRLPLRPPRVGHGTLSWCVKASTARVRAAFDRRGRVALALSTARGHGNRGVHPGGPGRRLRSAYPRRRRLSRGLYRAGPRSTGLIGVRARRVRFVAVATRRLLDRRPALRRAVRRLRR